MTASLHAGPRRSGTDIRTALAEYAPTELDTFEQEFHAALHVASTSFDTDPISDVLDRWWRLAVVRSIQLSDAEKDQLRRAQAGDFTGLLERTSDGTFQRIE